MPPPTNPTNAAAAPKDADEVEVKLRLPDEAAARAAADAIFAGGAHARPAAVGATHEQDNFFFDGAGSELGAQRCVLRLRFASSSRPAAAGAGGGKEEAGQEESAVLTLKGQQVLVGGIGVARELEAPLPDPRAARRYVSEPSLLVEEVLRQGKGGEAARGVLRELEGTEHGRAALASLACLGGFKNTRREVAWEFFVSSSSSSAAPSSAAAAAAIGAEDDDKKEEEVERALLELDETRYEWGTVYELEAEAPGAAAAERLRDALERVLKGSGVPFSRSSVSKFRNFVRRTLE